MSWNCEEGRGSNDWRLPTSERGDWERMIRDQTRMQIALAEGLTMLNVSERFIFTQPITEVSSNAYEGKTSPRTGGGFPCRRREPEPSEEDNSRGCAVIQRRKKTLRQCRKTVQSKEDRCVGSQLRNQRVLDDQQKDWRTTFSEDAQVQRCHVEYMARSTRQLRCQKAEVKMAARNTNKRRLATDRDGATNCEPLRNPPRMSDGSTGDQPRTPPVRSHAVQGRSHIRQHHQSRGERSYGGEGALSPTAQPNLPDLPRSDSLPRSIETRSPRPLRRGRGRRVAHVLSSWKGHPSIQGVLDARCYREYPGTDGGSLLPSHSPKDVWPHTLESRSGTGDHQGAPWTRIGGSDHQVPRYQVRRHAIGHGQVRGLHGNQRYCSRNRERAQDRYAGTGIRPKSRWVHFTYNTFIVVDPASPRVNPGIQDFLSSRIPLGLPS